MRVLHLQEPFSDLMKESTIFINRDALTPHYVPEQLLYRDKQINGIVKALTPALKGSRGRNLFIYGKTGTGKTCCIKYVIDKVSRLPSVRSKISYVPCKIYNSRYRVLNKIMSDHLPVYAKRGYGVVDIYEKMINWVEEDGKTLIVVMDEIDMVKDLDDIMYTLTRANSDVKHGGITIVGISNNISFKEDLDPRSISSLYETELVFPPYNSSELAEIMKQRAELGLKKDAVDASVINLIAAISAKESGDARLALKTLSMAGELAEEANRNKILVEDVQKAARNADEEIAYELVGMLPEHQRLVIYAMALLDIQGSRYKKLMASEDPYLFSGEIFDRYSAIGNSLHKEVKSQRWFRKCLSELEMQGLIDTKESGAGIRGHTKLIHLHYSAERLKGTIENSLKETEQ